MKISVVPSRSTRAFVVVNHDDGKIVSIKVFPVRHFKKDRVQAVDVSFTGNTNEYLDTIFYPRPSLPSAKKTAAVFWKIKRLQKDAFGGEAIK